MGRERRGSCCCDAFGGWDWVVVLRLHLLHHVGSGLPTVEFPIAVRIYHPERVLELFRWVALLTTSLSYSGPLGLGNLRRLLCTFLQSPNSLKTSSWMPRDTCAWPTWVSARSLGREMTPSERPLCAGLGRTWHRRWSCENLTACRWTSGNSAASSTSSMR